jgi:hypothetical protein
MNALYHFFYGTEEAVKASSSSSSPHTIIDLQENNHFKCNVIGGDGDCSDTFAPQHAYRLTSKLYLVCCSKRMRTSLIDRNGDSNISKSLFSGLRNLSYSSSSASSGIQ